MASKAGSSTGELWLKVNETGRSRWRGPGGAQISGGSASRMTGEGTAYRAGGASTNSRSDVREMTSRTRGPWSVGDYRRTDAIPHRVARLLRFLPDPGRARRNLEAWICRRSRSYLWRQWGNAVKLLQGAAPPWRIAVRAGCRRRLTNGIWRTSAHPAVRRPAQPPLRSSVSRRLHVPAAANSIEPPCNDPYVLWCGGAAPRGVPLSRSIRSKFGLVPGQMYVASGGMRGIRTCLLVGLTGEECHRDAEFPCLGKQRHMTNMPPMAFPGLVLRLHQVRSWNLACSTIRSA